MISLEIWQATGHTFAYHEHDIFYRVSGQGDVLLCIHGFPTASWDWHKLWPELEKRFRVVTADMIGFGFSAKPLDYAYSFADQANLFETLLDQLGINRVHILAHDYGDTVLQELLARRLEGRLPFHIQSAILLNGGISLKPPIRGPFKSY